MKPRNPRITPKDRSLIKGALRRAFARSALHQEVMNSITVEHSNPKNPRCKKWGFCQVCKDVLPRWRLVVDHIIPFVKTDTTFEEMSLDEAVDRLWCDKSNLQSICPTCHKIKSSLEAKERKARRQLKKNVKQIK